MRGTVVATAIALPIACGSYGTAPTNSDVPADAGDASAPVDSADPVADGGLVDAAADAGDASCNGVVACERMVFITSAVFDGRLEGLVGADGKCQAAADASALQRVRQRKFVAWLSDGVSSTGARLVHGTAPYRRVDGTAIAADWDDLVAGGLDATITFDENGNLVAGAELYTWTGTQPDGGRDPQSCSDWTSTAGAGMSGRADRTNVDWTAHQTEACTQGLRLYCFER